MSRPVYIDIDGTLTDAPGKQWGNPVQHRINCVRQMVRDGVHVVLWSGNGTEYALAWAGKHGLAKVTALGKPEFCVDDNPTIRSRSRMPIKSPVEFFGA